MPIRGAACSAIRSKLMAPGEVVRSLGRVRFGTERHYVLKLNSQLSRFLPDFRRAFTACAGYDGRGTLVRLRHRRRAIEAGEGIDSLVCG